jgi:uncharacterized repeat protein (TIGR03803 family)
MCSKLRSPSSIFGINCNRTGVTLSSLLALLFVVFSFLLLALTPTAAFGQTYEVIYNFTGGLDGCCLLAGLTIDRGGNFYGTAAQGGTNNDGVVFSLRRAGSGWIETPLYNFVFGQDGAAPESPVVFGPDGSLYGTTKYGGGGTCPYGCGTVYNLRPPATVCGSESCSWIETQLYSFPSPSDGEWPSGDGVVFSSAGNLYGTVPNNDPRGCNGQLYKLTRSDGHWSKSDSYDFGCDNNVPNGVRFDQMGNLYGTSSNGGPHGNGSVFRLRPSQNGWVDDLLYTFQGEDDGGVPLAGVVLDSLGNFYGSTSCGGAGGGGTVFMLSPAGESWTFTVLYSFAPPYCGGPRASLSLDAAGNLYGTTASSGIYGHGSGFKLTPSPAGWSYLSLHDFGGGGDGNGPQSALIQDANGSLYGTTPTGGIYGWGVVFKITP